MRLAAHPHAAPHRAVHAPQLPSSMRYVVRPLAFVDLAALVFVQSEAVPAALRPRALIVRPVSPDDLSLAVRHAINPIPFKTRAVRPHHPPMPVCLPVTRLAAETDELAYALRAVDGLDPRIGM